MPTLVPDSNLTYLFDIDSTIVENYDNFTIIAKDNEYFIFAIRDINTNEYKTYGALYNPITNSYVPGFVFTNKYRIEKF